MDYLVESLGFFVHCGFGSAVVARGCPEWSRHRKSDKEQKKAGNKHLKGLCSTRVCTWVDSQRSFWINPHETEIGIAKIAIADLLCRGLGTGMPKILSQIVCREGSYDILSRHALAFQTRVSWASARWVEEARQIATTGVREDKFRPWIAVQQQCSYAAGALASLHISPGVFAMRTSSAIH